MRSVRRSGTECEIAIGRALRALGLRFRTDWPFPDTRRRVDFAFVRPKVAVFVDGCFWHACPVHATWPRSNAVWWRSKIAANVARDRDTDKHLRKTGWKVVRIWEHEDPRRAATRVMSALRHSPLASKR